MINRKPLVMKFGGSSLEDAHAFDRVARIVLGRQQCQPIVVVSAIRNMTDALLSAVQHAKFGDGNGAAVVIEDRLAAHMNIAEQLLTGVRKEVFDLAADRERELIRWLLAEIGSQPDSLPQLSDELVSRGEQLSAALMTQLLLEREMPASYVDASRCIVTDDNFGNASPDVEETKRAVATEIKPLLDAVKVPVLGGFIGATKNGVSTTLGRNGSDFTAALVGEAIDAAEIQIWSDVSGVLTADPALVPDAKTIAHLNYAEAENLARLGAKVLHPKTVAPAVRTGIPISILNSRRPMDAGTKIHAATNGLCKRSVVISKRAAVAFVKIRPHADSSFDLLRYEIADFVSGNPFESVLISSSMIEIAVALYDTIIEQQFDDQFSDMNATTHRIRGSLVSLAHHRDNELSQVAEFVSIAEELGSRPIVHGQTETSLMVGVLDVDADELVRSFHNKMRRDLNLREAEHSVEESERLDASGFEGGEGATALDTLESPCIAVS